MSIFAISDLHLSLGCDKPMDVFGSKWLNYTERMRKNWNSIVTASDYVIIPGDISWATYIDDAVRDFEYINNLNGKKILLKGNHDYWWTTASKMTKFFEKNNFDTIRFVQNNSVIISDNNRKIAICGTRGWCVEGSPDFKEQDRKIYLREAERLKLALSAAEKVKEEGDGIIALIHYPPFNVRRENSLFTDLFEKYGVSDAVYGHLHGKDCRTDLKIEKNGVRYILTSCDQVDNKLTLIKEEK